LKYAKTNLSDSERISNSNYYKQDTNVRNYRNIIYYIEIELEKYLAKLLTKNQLDRIIWSSSDFALRKRGGNAQEDVTNTLDLPFVSYKLTDVNTDTQRQLFNNYMNVNGVYLSDAEVMVKTAPMHLEYEVVFWCNRDEELVYATHNFLFDMSNETLIHPSIPLETGKSIVLPAFISFSGSYNDVYSQSDYIISNKIRTLSMTFSIDTYILKEVGNTLNSEGIGSFGSINIPLVKTVIFDFFNSKNINTEAIKNGDINIYDSEMEILLRDYFSDDEEIFQELKPPVVAPT